MKRILAAFGLSIFLSSGISAQETAIITYDFKNSNSLQGVLPYDQPFRIHFLNVDSPQVRSITVVIYQADISDYQRLLKKYPSGNTNHRARELRKIELTNQDVLDLHLQPALKPDSILRGVDFAGREAYLKSFLTLKPNTGYFIEIRSHRVDSLSKDERAAVLEYFEKDPSMNSIINEFANYQIDNPKADFTPINSTLSQRLIDTAKVKIKEINENYVLTGVDRVKLKRYLGECFAGLDNVVANIENASVEYPDTSNRLDLLKDKDTVQLNKTRSIIIDSLKEINWGATREDDKKIVIIDSLVHDYFEKIKASGERAITDENADEIMDSLYSVINRKRTAIMLLYAETIIINIGRNILLNDTYPKEFVKQAGQFITSDLGLAYVWGIGRVNPYAAIHISPSPLNDSTPLRQYRGLGGFLRSRFSFMIGISIDAIAKDSVRRGIIGDQALIVGGGFRVWTWFRINGGSYLYYREPSNPLLPRDRLTFTGSPFFSFSIDIRVQSLLKGVGTAIFKNQQTP